MMALLYLAFGAAFGFALSRARASDYDTIIAMFRGRDLHLAGVIGVAIATSAIGLALVRRRARRALVGAPIDIQPKPYRRGVFTAGLLFGAGWALTGTCPGTALVQLGELKSYALFTMAGIFAGTYAYARAKSGTPG
jgi:uncharacterized membrane protein YedE/YeeE